MKKLWQRSAIGCALAACVAITPRAAAQEAEDVAPATNAGSVAVSLGVDVANAYYFRGIVQETDGVVVQPAVKIGVTAYEGEGALRSFAIEAGLWSSAHSAAADRPENVPTPWYEADAYASLVLGLPQSLSATLTYTLYTSPNGSFRAVNELALGLAWDDSSVYATAAPWFAGIRPSLTIAREIEGTAFGGGEGTYLQPGVNPGANVVSEGPLTLAVSVPLTVGLGLGEYYETDTSDDTFGYFDAGLNVSLGLGFVPERLGAWEVRASGHVLVLGDNLAAANDGDTAAFVGAAGLGMSY